MNYNKKLGHAIKFIRLSRSIKQEWIALKIGYSDKSTYAKIESGKIKEVSISKLQLISEVLQCNTLHFIIMADSESFNNPILNWEEFLTSLHKCNKADLLKMMGIVQDVFPAKYKLYENLYLEILSKHNS